MKKILFTVTNDLSFDQRMIRICSTLQKAGYDVTLIGRKRKGSIPLMEQGFHQKRLNCFAQKGKMFYLEYNFRLFFYLLFKRFDALCSIDLDTILPGYFVSSLKRKPCIYDAHEYFTEVPEVVERPKIQKMWAWVAQRTIPNFKYAYTVCNSLAEVFKEKYGTSFEVIRNVPFARTDIQKQSTDRPILLYQGVLNDGRGLEEIIDALPELPEVDLWLAGEGDLSEDLRTKVSTTNLDQQVKFLGYVQPHDLPALTDQAFLGLNLLKNKGLNYYYSLANKFFDYLQGEKPSLNMEFPEYQFILDKHKVGLMVPDLTKKSLVTAVRSLLDSPEVYAELCRNCQSIKAEYTWEEESLKLIQFYKNVFRA